MSYLIHDVGENKLSVVNVLPDNLSNHGVDGSYLIHDVGENRLKVITVTSCGGGDAYIPFWWLCSFAAVCLAVVTITLYIVVGSDSVTAVKYMLGGTVFLFVLSYLTHKPIGGKK